MIVNHHSGYRQVNLDSLQEQQLLLSPELSSPSSFSACMGAWCVRACVTLAEPWWTHMLASSTSLLTSTFHEYASYKSVL